MAYVRRRGNQLAIVHGVRDPETRKVEQQILFTLYSKGEALEALGRREGSRAERFQMLLEQQFPDIRFDWPKIHRAIAEHMDHLPDLYEYRTSRLLGRFRGDLCAFARQLILADPQELISASHLIREQRIELEYVAELIRWRLELCEQEEDKWNVDNPFYWRFTMRGSYVPPDIEEEAEGFYERGEYNRAEAVFRLLIDCFDRYAEGYNYLGLIALERDQLDDAIGHFEKTIEVGRRLFPKRIAKKRYWSDLSTRPYMRGLRNLALTLNRAGKYAEALTICERLEQQCGDEITVRSHRASIYLNTGRWRLAADAGLELHRLMPTASLVAALASFEIGDHRQATFLFLHGALHSPRAARMLVGVRTGRPKGHDEVSDYNHGVQLRQALGGYLHTWNVASRRFFRQLVGHPRTVALLDEMENVVRQRHEQHPTGEREAFNRMQEMREPAFARAEAQQIADAL